MGCKAVYWGFGILDVAVNAEEMEVLSENIAGTLERWRKLHPKQILEDILDGILGFGPDLLAALLVFVIGVLVTRALCSLLGKLLKNSKVDKTLHYFIRTAMKIALYALIVITCLGILGIPLTPMITALGAIGLALSLAVQDSLTNLAGGLSILVNRPFAVGDFIELNGMSGTVRQIRLVYTLISSTDNKHIYLTNGDVAKAVVTNYSAESTRRVDLSFSVRGDSDLSEAKKIIRQEVERCEQILADPAPIVRISGQSYVLVQIACLVWVNSTDYFAVNELLIERVRGRLVQEGFYSRGAGEDQ